MAQLPQELIVEIMIWLPVKSLKRFRCLSKEQCGVIDSSDFINWHLNRSSQNLRSKMIFPYLSREKIHVCDVNVDLEEEEEEVLPVVVQQDSTLWRNGDLCGNCNGLLLLCRNLIKFGFSLWNPSTSQFRDLPDPPFEIPVADNVWYIIIGSGLGYDDSTDDYKAVIMIFVDVDDVVEVQIWIYSLKSNIWRRAPNFPYYWDDGCSEGGRIDYWNVFFDERIGYFIDGSLHWVTGLKIGIESVDLRREIVAFDVKKETFSLVSQPAISSIDSEDSFYLPHLSVLEGCLCINYLYYSTPSRFDLFIRKKDGVDQFCWIKLFSATEPSFLCSSMKVLRYSKRGDKILLNLGDMTLMVSYDVEEKSFKKVQIDVDPKWRSPFVCIESLVSVGGEA